MTRLTRFLPRMGVVLSALLLTLAFAPWDMNLVVWFALVPWLATLARTPKLSQAIVQSFWLSFLFTVFGFYWSAAALREVYHLSWPAVVFAFALYAWVGQLQFPLYAIASRVFRPRVAPWMTPLILALFYVALDFTVPKLFQDTLGHTLYRVRTLRQIADIGGPLLISFLIFATNVAIYETLRQRKPLRHLATPLILIIASAIYGKVRIDELRLAEAQSSESLRFAVIQPNIGNYLKVIAKEGGAGAVDEVFNLLIAQSEVALKQVPRPQVLVWPETVYPLFFRERDSDFNRNYNERLNQFVRSNQISLSFGGNDRLEGRFYNALFFISAFSEPGEYEVYHKNILIPFGEYLPGTESFESLRNVFQIYNMSRGATADLFYLRNPNDLLESVPLMPLICYEALFSDHVIQGARKGAKVILNTSNDSWFRAWGGPELHLSGAIFRSIETRLPQVRSTNTGISAFISTDGEITQATQVGTAETLIAEVKIPPFTRTLMMQWGNWFGLFAVVASVVGILLPKTR